MHLEAEYLLQSLFTIHNIPPPRLDTLAENSQAAIVLRNNAVIGPPEMASSGLLLVATLLARPDSGVTTHDFQKYVDHYAIDDLNYRIGNNRHNDYKEGYVALYLTVERRSCQASIQISANNDIDACCASKFWIKAGRSCGVCNVTGT
jgi:hypothetical protein